jgi:hypothetical protein
MRNTKFQEEAQVRDETNLVSNLFPSLRENREPGSQPATRSLRARSTEGTTASLNSDITIRNNVSTQQTESESTLETSSISGIEETVMVESAALEEKNKQEQEDPGLQQIKIERAKFEKQRTDALYEQQSTQKMKENLMKQAMAAPSNTDKKSSGTKRVVIAAAAEILGLGGILAAGPLGILFHMN